MTELPVIALLTASSTKESTWRNLLSEANFKVFSGAALTSVGVPIDLVITDSHQHLKSGQSWRGTNDIYGVIGVGTDFAADVVFPDDPAERELQIACDLLYEIVQLRRERETSLQTQQLLTEIAELDALTGLANRRAWDTELKRRIERASKSESTLCLALLDLDHFKQVNTAYGYAVADDVLQQAGSAITASLRSGDFVARIGGDEFGVLLENIAPERAAPVVERIRASIQLRLEIPGSDVVTATAGFAIQEGNCDAAALFAAADTNLRHGKASGRNQTIASTQ